MQWPMQWSAIRGLKAPSYTEEQPINNSHILPSLFAALRRGKPLKGNKHYCGFSTPHGNKNPKAILHDLFIGSS